MSQRKTVHVDVFSNDTDAAAKLLRTYGGRNVEKYNDYGEPFACGYVNRTRVAHLKSTATKKGLRVDVEA